MSFVLGGAGTESSKVYPLAAAKPSEFVAATAASSKSPLAVVFRLPLFGDALVPVAATDASTEFDVATPEYSRMAIRSGPETVSVTVTVFAPPLIFSA